MMTRHVIIFINLSPTCSFQGEVIDWKPKNTRRHGQQGSIASALPSRGTNTVAPGSKPAHLAGTLLHSVRAGMDGHAQRREAERHELRKHFRVYPAGPPGFSETEQYGQTVPTDELEDDAEYDVGSGDLEAFAASSGSGSAPGTAAGSTDPRRKLRWFFQAIGNFFSNAAKTITKAVQPVVNAANQALDYAALAVEAISCLAGECTITFRIPTEMVPFPPYPRVPRM
eukprot:tig00020878_g14859.t1